MWASRRQRQTTQGFEAVVRGGHATLGAGKHLRLTLLVLLWSLPISGAWNLGF